MAVHSTLRAGRWPVALSLLAIAASVLAPHLVLAVSEGGSCGGFIGIRCDNGLWCEMPARACGLADGQGKCTKLPEACTEQYQPVCGCNNVTYSNDCRRAMAQVTKKADGACK